MDVHGIPPETAGQLDRIGSADLVIGLPGCADGAAVSAAARTWRGALRALAPVSRLVVIHADPATPGGPAAVSATDGADVQLLYAPLVGADRLDALASGFPETVRHVAQIARRLEARATCVLGSLSTAVTPGEIRNLVAPVLEQGIDLMVPRYEAGRFDGLIARAVLAPVTRALYGRRVADPMVTNFAASAALSARLAQSADGRARPSTWLASEAICSGLSVGQASTHRPEPAGDHADLGTVFGSVLGPLFLDIERRAACWQRIQGSRPVPTIGEPVGPAGAAPPIDADRMVESFRAAFGSLAEMWSTLLPPATLLELKKLAQAPIDRFRVADELWARIVYDVSLGYRLRVINRDHLLRSFVPLYLAWVASWVLQATDELAAVERQEQLGAAFERQKPYLLSRWRWPDRFSP